MTSLQAIQSRSGTFRCPPCKLRGTFAVERRRRTRQVDDQEVVCSTSYTRRLDAYPTATGAEHLPDGDATGSDGDSIRRYL